MVRYRAADGLSVDMGAKEFVSLLAGGSYVTEQDAWLLIARAKARGLNPLAGDAYVVVRKGADGQNHSTLQVSKDYYLRVAAAQPSFDGIEAGVIVAKADGTLERRKGALVSANPKVEKLVGGWAEVYVKGRSHPSYSEVSLPEYDLGKSLWKSKPATMIRKVALVQALREAYPSQFAQLYDDSEMPQDGHVPTEAYEGQGTEYEEEGIEPDEIGE